MNENQLEVNKDHITSVMISSQMELSTLASNTESDSVKAYIHRVCQLTPNLIYLFCVQVKDSFDLGRNDLMIR